MPSRRGFFAACLGLLGLPAAIGQAEPEAPHDAVCRCCEWAEPESYTMTIDDGTGGFDSFGEYLVAVRDASLPGGECDPRLIPKET